MSTRSLALTEVELELILEALDLEHSATRNPVRRSVLAHLRSRIARVYRGRKA